MDQLLFNHAADGLFKFAIQKIGFCVETDRWMFSFESEIGPAEIQEPNENFDWEVFHEDGLTNPGHPHCAAFCMVHNEMELKLGKTFEAQSSRDYLLPYSHSYFGYHSDARCQVTIIAESEESLEVEFVGKGYGEGGTPDQTPFEKHQFKYSGRLVMPRVASSKELWLP